MSQAISRLSPARGFRGVPDPVRRAATRIALTAAVIAAAKLVASVLDAHGILHASTPLPVIVLGVIIGLTYGLLAVGIVLVFRANGIVNFAHGQIGAFGAALFGIAATKWHVPYWIAFVLALAVSGGVGTVAEAAVVRRLRSAPRLMSIVATLGVGQFLVVLASVINGNASAGQLYPQPSWLPSFSIGALRLTPAYTGMLLLSVVLVVGLSVFLKRSRFGLAIRAAAANPEGARLSGIFASRMSSLAWALAGALSGFTAILTAPTQGYISGDTFGPGLLLRAMAAAVIGRMQSLPLALAGGVGVGVGEQLLLWNYPRAGLIDIVMFVAILVTLLLQRNRSGRDEEKGSWAIVQGLRPIPRQFRGDLLIRSLSPVAILVVLVAIGVLPLVASNSLCVTFTGILGFAIVGLSISVLTGQSGQLTLGQFAVAAIGAVVSVQVSSRTGNFALGLLLAGVVAGVVSVIVGLPALRIRGLMLTVTTLGFALATPSLLSRSWMLGAGKRPGRPTSPFGGTLDTGRQYYYFAFMVFVICVAVALAIRRSGFGRLLVAIRDNEDNARAFAVRATRVKLQGYLVAGFIAGIGGATYGHSLSNLDASVFPASASIQVVVMTVLGGLSVLLGPVIGAAWVLGLPLLNIGNIGLAATNLGALLLILWKPGGLVQLVVPVRDGLVRLIARRRHLDHATPRATRRGVGTDGVPDGLSAVGETTSRAVFTRSGDRALTELPPGQPLLEARNLSKRFGGVVAVRDVSMRVAAGETVGLIGPNGAGKTTTFELLSGFVRPDHGSVHFAGRDVSRLGPTRRADLGLIRSFQDAALFPTMTVEESVLVAFERVAPSQFATSILGLRLGERTKTRRARALLSAMGLDAYRDSQIQELSTGTRRIAEIACLVALEPVCLLLDEPSSGIAQRETESLGALLLDLKSSLGLTMLVIEHDIPLVMGISDRIVAMSDGLVLCEGEPHEVRNDPGVVEAYLGGSVTAIARSGAVPAST